MLGEISSKLDIIIEQGRSKKPSQNIIVQAETLQRRLRPSDRFGRFGFPNAN
jgi:hypothetical protein